MLWKFELKGHQKADSFQGVEPLVHVVTQKDVFVALHLVLVRKTEVFEQSHQIIKTTVDTAKYFGRRPHSHQTAFLEDYSRDLLT